MHNSPSNNWENQSQNLPRHLAVIMDGNGRWAERHGKARSQGHSKGVENVRDCVSMVADAGIDYLTLFAFSSENWQRPKTEVNFLMSLLKRYIKSDLADLHNKGVRVRVIGRREGLTPSLRELIDHAETLTLDNQKLHLQIAFNYGGREEIMDAAQRIAKRVAAGTLDPALINEDVLSSEMLTAGLPDPDLIIRTSGEIRVSNFLLWQAAYSEFYFTDVLWPDFGREDFNEALKVYASRSRRFGGVDAKLAQE